MAATSNSENSELETTEEQTIVSSNQFPLVFQCSKCNIIIGDSLGWVCANEALRSFTVGSVSSNVTVGKKLQLAEEGPDLGSSYFVLKCGQCSKELGRRYISTNKNLDDLREYFTLFVDNCNSYQTGSSKQTIDLGSLNEDRKYVNMQIKEMKEVMLRMNDRVTGIEQALKIQEEENQPYDGSQLNHMNSSMDRSVLKEKKRRMSALGDASDGEASSKKRSRIKHVA